MKATIKLPNKARDGLKCLNSVHTPIACLQFGEPCALKAAHRDAFVFVQAELWQNWRETARLVQASPVVRHGSTSLLVPALEKGCTSQENGAAIRQGQVVWMRVAEMHLFAPRETGESSGRACLGAAELDCTGAVEPLRQHSSHPVTSPLSHSPHSPSPATHSHHIQ